MREIAEKLGQNMDVFEMRDLIIKGKTVEFLEKIQNSPNLSKVSLSPEKDEEILLGVAIRCGNFECARAIIKAGANVNQMESMRKSILLEALRHGEFKIAKIMIDAGAHADPKLVGDYQWHLRHLVDDEGEYNALIDRVKMEPVSL